MMGLTIPENLECSTAHHKQLNHVVDVLPETSQNTKMDATLAKPEVNATTPKVNVMNSKEELKDEQTRNEQRLDNQPTHKSQPQQMLDKAKADKVKMKETYKQAKLVNGRLGPWGGPPYVYRCMRRKPDVCAVWAA